MLESCGQSLWAAVQMVEVRRQLLSEMDKAIQTERDDDDVRVFEQFDPGLIVQRQIRCFLVTCISC